MQSLILIRGLLLLHALTFGLFSTATGQEQKMGQSQNHEELARRVVLTSAGVKPGDVVVVSGGKHTIPLMEAIAIEARKAGGLVTMFLNSDRVIHSRNVDVPEQYLEQEPHYLVEWFKHVDVYIGLPSAEDPQTAIAGVPQARIAKISKAERVVTNMLNEAKLRYLSIGYPTRQFAELNQLDFATYEKIFREALNADYRMISEKGKTLKQILQGAKVVRVVSPDGTDFTFSIGDRPVIVDDGIVTAEDAQSKVLYVRSAFLPGGRAFVAPIETSANGKVMAPKARCRNEPLTGVSFEFKNGKLQNFKADRNAECFNATMAAYSGSKDMFGAFSIGLNHNWKVMEAPGDYRPAPAAGMVQIGIGNNQLTGGNNADPGSFSFPITRATVTVDGKVVVKDGRLAF